MCRAGFQIHCAQSGRHLPPLPAWNAQTLALKRVGSRSGPSNQRSSSIFGDERTGEKALLFHGAAVDHLVERARGGLSDRFGGIEN